MKENANDILLELPSGVWRNGIIVVSTGKSNDGGMKILNDFGSYEAKI